MDKRPNGIDTNAIVLDSDGRFELNEPQLAKISGGRRKRKIIVIEGTKCHVQKPWTVINGTHCH